MGDSKSVGGKMPVVPIVGRRVHEWDEPRFLFPSGHQFFCCEALAVHSMVMLVPA
jgi:hypothetical protein